MTSAALASLFGLPAALTQGIQPGGVVGPPAPSPPWDAPSAPAPAPSCSSVTPPLVLRARAPAASRSPAASPRPRGRPRPAASVFPGRPRPQPSAAAPPPVSAGGGRGSSGEGARVSRDPAFLGARNILGSSQICQQPKCLWEIQRKQLCGCGLLGVGIWLSVSQGNFATFSPSFPSLSAANLVIAMGTIVMVTGFLGCLGAIKENKCLLLSFFIVLLIILLAELILLILFFVYMDKVNENAKKDLKEGLLLYNTENNVGLKNAWNIIQAEMRCCGVTDYTDWYPVLGENAVPDRCCMENSQGCGRNSTTPLWKTGCYEKVKLWFDDNKHVLGMVGMSILIMQILGMAFSMTLFQHIHRTGKKYDA
uniref:Tetraspanin-9 n=2 Tax=Rhinolophus ferrumequinum TaxID=59479 RepID=A0A671FW12_RHIFE